MWEFPSTNSFINSNGFQIFWTLLVAVFSALAWWNFYRSIKHNHKESFGEFLKNTSIGAVTLLLAFFSSWSLISNYNITSKCRNLDLTEVKSVRFKKIPSEDNFTGSTILFADKAKIQEGLSFLKNANSYDRKKVDGAREKFLYGYKIELIFNDNLSGPILYYFSETDNSKKLDVVIPRCEADSDEINTTENIYSSQAFGNWLRENIESQFKNIQ